MNFRIRFEKESSSKRKENVNEESKRFCYFE
jgi:hypothetical protein